MHGILGRRHREEKMRDAERGAMKRADEESRFVLPSVLTFFRWKIIGFEMIWIFWRDPLSVHLYPLQNISIIPVSKPPNYHVWDNINQHYVPLHSWTLLNRVIYNRCLLQGSMKVNRCLGPTQAPGPFSSGYSFRVFYVFFVFWLHLILAVAFGLPFLGPCFPSELFADVTSWAPLFDNIVTTR